MAKMTKEEMAEILKAHGRFSKYSCVSDVVKNFSWKDLKGYYDDMREIMTDTEKIVELKNYIEKQRAWILKALDYPENQDTPTQCKLYAELDSLRKVENIIK